MIKQGGVSLNGEPVKNEFDRYPILDGMIIKVGKKIITRHRKK